LPFPKSAGQRSEKPLDLINSDVGFMPIESIGGNRLYVTFIDDFSRYAKVVVIKKKSEVFD